MLTLREATEADWARLFFWRNDPLTRANSGSTAPVPLDGHMKWLRAQLKDPQVHLLVAHDPERSVSVGTGRLEAYKEGVWQVSITVDPAQRGHGYATSLIAALVHRALLEGDVRKVRAEVREENLPSLRAFADNAFVLVRVKDGIATLERSL